MPNLDLTIAKIMHGDNEVYMIKQGDTRIWPQYLSYPVTYTLDGVTTDGSNKALESHSFTTTLTPENGKTLLQNTVRVIMGDYEVTDSCYNFETNIITIDNVTDNIEITAEAVTISSTLLDAYDIVTYIGVVKKDASPGIKFTSIQPTQNTKISTSLRMWGVGRRMISYPGGDASTSAFLAVGDVSGVGKFCWNKKMTNASHKFATYVQKRFDLICDKGNFSVQCKTLNLSQTSNMHVDGETFTGTNLTLMGNTTSTSDGAMYGDIYELIHWSDNVLINRYVPARRKSDNKVGMLDIYGSGGFALKNNYSWLAPYIRATNTYTNCTLTKLGSSDSGLQTSMTIGKVWQYKYAPSTGYTFNDANAVFTVMVNDVDVTSTAAVYDSSTDSWTVTLTAHWNDEISIIATAVA